MTVMNRTFMLVISTHAPYTEGDARDPDAILDLTISTHAPYTEGDIYEFDKTLVEELFQLTPPIQRATFTFCVIRVTFWYFNSRPLYRGRLNALRTSSAPLIFQLTPPIQRATGLRRT